MSMITAEKFVILLKSYAIIIEQFIQGNFDDFQVVFCVCPLAKNLCTVKKCDQSELCLNMSQNGLTADWAYQLTRGLHDFLESSKIDILQLHYYFM